MLQFLRSLFCFGFHIYEYEHDELGWVVECRKCAKVKNN